MSETGRSIVLESGMGGGDIRLPIDDGGSGSRGSSIFDPTDLDAIFPKGGCFGSGGCTPEICGSSSGSLLNDPIARSAGLPSGDGCFGTGGGGGILDAAGDGAAGVVMDGCFDPNAGGIDLQGALGGALSSAVGSALNSLLAVNDETPAGEAIAKTLISKYKEQLLEFLHDPGGMLSKIRALFHGIESAANVPIGVAVPIGGPVVLLQKRKRNPINGPATRLGDNLIMTEENDAGPFVQGNPTVLLNGKPAAGKGHLAIGLSKKTPGEARWVATTVLMGTATVTDLSVYKKAKEAAANSGSQSAGGLTPAEKAAEINRRLDEAGWLGADDEARNIVDQLSEEEIRNLPAATRNRLIETLQSGYQSDDDDAALHKIYESRAVDPEFDAIDRQTRAAMTEAFKSDSTLQTASKDWPTMSEAERLAALQRAADLQAETYGFPKTTIETYDQPADKDGFLAGYYNHSDGKLQINTTNQTGGYGGFEDFNEILDTVTHENAHRYQRTLADEFESGNISPEDPIYEQARTFSLNNNYYVKTPPEVYENQPMEQHSRDTGGGASRAFP